jgi:hypothetical protein
MRGWVLTKGMFLMRGMGCVEGNGFLMRGMGFDEGNGF